jgi:hypothetical protein
MSKFEYDAWFDDNIPKAMYGSLQCWIANENTKPWTSAYDMTIHSIMYAMAVKEGLIQEEYDGHYNS